MDRFRNSRNFLATDKVPDTIFGIPIAKAEGEWTEADIAFFRDHPEAGGYYSMGDEETPEDGTEEGAPVQADNPKPAFASVPRLDRSFSLSFETPLSTRTVKTKDGKTVVYVRPTKSGSGENTTWDINGYRNYVKNGVLVPHTNDGEITMDLYRKSVDAEEAEIARKTGAFLKALGADEDKLSPEARLVLSDIMFSTGGDAIRRKDRSPTLYRIVDQLGRAGKHGRGMSPEDALTVALALEGDSYGALNYGRLSSRSGLLMNAMERSANLDVRAMAEVYRRGWDGATATGNRDMDAVRNGTSWAKHSGGMRALRRYAGSLGLDYTDTRK